MSKRARVLQIPDIQLQKRSNVSLCGQLYAALRREIIDGRLAAGQRIPSSRVLARHLPASRNTLLQAFERLVSEGYLIGRVGSGTRVARPQPRTYLSELPRPASTKNKSFRQIVRESFYPASTACLRDSDGNVIYLFRCD